MGERRGRRGHGRHHRPRAGAARRPRIRRIAAGRSQRPQERGGGSGRIRQGRVRRLFAADRRDRRRQRQRGGRARAGQRRRGEAGVAVQAPHRESIGARRPDGRSNVPATHRLRPKVCRQRTRNAPMNAPTRPARETTATKFERRHIGPSPRDLDAMLAAVGAQSMEALIAQTIPAEIRRSAPLDLEPAVSETEALARLRELADANTVFTSLIGQGYHGTILPPVILRNILENPAWYTAYTPYQPEISQGRLEALLNYQTLIRDLTGLDIANASLLDEATAAAEAMALAKRAAPSKSNRFFVDRELHPQTIAVLRTRAEPLGWSLVLGDPAT